MYKYWLKIKGKEFFIITLYDSFLMKVAAAKGLH